jgi:hypothetical protein
MQSGGRFEIVSAVLDEDHGGECVIRQPHGSRNLQAGGRLQGGEQELFLGVSPDNEVHPEDTPITDSIEEHKRFRASGEVIG